MHEAQPTVSQHWIDLQPSSILPICRTTNGLFAAFESETIFCSAENGVVCEICLVPTIPSKFEVGGKLRVLSGLGPVRYMSTSGQGGGPFRYSPVHCTEMDMYRTGPTPSYPPGPPSNSSTILPVYTSSATTVAFAAISTQQDLLISAPCRALV